MNVKKLFKDIKKEKAAYVFILPSVIMFLLFVLYPMILSVMLSFQDANLISSKWIGFTHYFDLFKDKYFIFALKNTALFVLILVPITVFIAFLVANRISTLGKRTMVFFRASFYLPVVVSGVVISLIWLWIFNPTYGLLNYFLSLAGKNGVVWLASKYTLAYLMFVVFTFNFGVPLTIYLAAIGNIPHSLYEAARIDGAHSRIITWKIKFPLVKPTTFFLFVTQTIAVFQTWIVIQILTNGGPAHRTETIVYQIYTNAFQYNQFGRASAMGMILLIIIMALTLVQKFTAGDEVDY